jgi:hypothetical protein
MCWRTCGRSFAAYLLRYRYTCDVDIDRADRAADRNEVDRFVFGERWRSARRIAASEI